LETQENISLEKSSKFNAFSALGLKEDNCGDNKPEAEGTANCDGLLGYETDPKGDGLVGYYFDNEDF